MSSGPTSYVCLRNLTVSVNRWTGPVRALASAVLGGGLIGRARVLPPQPGPGDSWPSTPTSQPQCPGWGQQSTLVLCLFPLYSWPGQTSFPTWSLNYGEQLHENRTTNWDQYRELTVYWKKHNL